MTLRLRLLWLPLSALLGVAVLLLVPVVVDRAPGAPAVDRQAGAEGVGSPILLASGPGAGETPDEPALVGRAVRRGPAPGRGPVRVTVLGPADRPLPGFRVVASWPGSDGSPEQGDVGIATAARTDANGRAVFEDLAHDGSVTVRAVRASNGKTGWGDATAVIAGPDVTLRVRFGLPLEVRPVAADSGVKHERASVRGERGVLGSFADECTAMARALPGAYLRFDVRIEAPAGWVAWDRVYGQVPISAWATRLVSTYPLRREADVRVLVVDHEGHAEARATICQFKLGERTRGDVQVDDLAPGRFRLRGVPFFRGEKLIVGATSPAHMCYHCGTATLPDHPADTTELVVTLPPPGHEPITFGGGDGGFSRFLCGRPFKHESTEPSTLKVRVLRRDGTPAAHALMTLDSDACRLDAKGELVRRDLDAGTYQVTLRALGLLPMHASVVTRSGEETLLVLREPRGGRIDLRVVGPDGRPLPYARFDLETPTRHPWTDEEGGVQRIDRYVDHQGRRRLDHVETGTVKVKATWASRKAEQDVEVREGEMAHVELVLR